MKGIAWERPDRIPAAHIAYPAEAVDRAKIGTSVPCFIPGVVALIPASPDDPKVTLCSGSKVTLATISRLTDCR